MISISTLVVTVKHPDGRTEEVQVDSDRVLIGSGAHCEVRLAREHGAIEVLLVEARSGGVFAEARSLHPPPMLNGTPFTSGRLLPDAVVSVADLSLSVRVIETSSQPGASRRQKSGGSLSYVFAGAMFAAALYMLLNTPGADASMAKMPPPSKLWPQTGPATCPQPPGAAAAAFAGEQMLLADGKRERAPFYFHDGVAAVDLFERAAACFAAGGDAEAARDAGTAAERLRRKMSEDFHVHRVRLERALAPDDHEGARTELGLLLNQLQGRSDEYVTYLASLDRRLELKFSGKKQKKQ
jgi:hypothetical protein